MKSAAQNFAEGIRWDLTDLYKSPEDPKIESDLRLAGEKAAAFEKKYKPYFESLVSSLLSPSSSSPHGVRRGSMDDDSRLKSCGNDEGAADTIHQLPLADLLKDLKEIATLLTKPGCYAHLAFAEKTNEPARGAFMQKIQARSIDIHSHILFFDVSWNQLDPKTAEALMSDPSVARERHYLEQLRVWAPHTLKEGEEKIMSLKSQTSSSAFSRLFDEVMNNIPFYIKLEGKRIKQTEAQVLARLHSKNREERKQAAESLAEGLKNNTHLLTYIYNMTLADHRLSQKIRNFKHPMDGRNLSNETDLASITHLIESVKKAYPLAHRYYELKRKLLGLEELFDYDRTAPLDEDAEKVDFGACKEIVLSGYYGFAEEAGKIAEMFFAKRWIDAEIREGKQGGGFCAQTTPELHPYILVNYTGSLRDVMTVAHELGHGLHQYLAGKHVGILESDAPLTMAETASVFGEMLIFEKILEKETNPKKRLALLCGKIDDNFATVFRQITMTDFELSAHLAGLEAGELPESKLNEFWIKANREFYGKSITLTESYQHAWKYIPHFVHTPFYCYAYAFAQLFVLTLYQKYKEDPKGFVPKYFEILSLGGSKRPQEIASLVNLNLRDPKFWQAGLMLLEELVLQAESLA